MTRPDETAARKRRTAVTASIALAGLVAAGVLYLVAPASGDAAGLPETKRYLREMELYGGTANVIASQFRQWFSGLWHGRALAGTVLVLSLLAALVAHVALTPLPPDVERPRPSPPQGPTNERR